MVARGAAGVGLTLSLFAIREGKRASGLLSSLCARLALPSLFQGGLFWPALTPQVSRVSCLTHSHARRGGASPRVNSDKTMFCLGSLPILGLLDPRSATRLLARASSLRVPMSRWHRVAPSRSTLAGIMDQRSAGASRKRLAQNCHSGGQPFRASGHWRDHSGQPDYRDGLCRPCRPSATRLDQAPCFANHQPRVLLRLENLPPASLCRTSAPCRMALI